MQDEYARIFWQDHVADTLDVIAHGLANMGNKHPKRIENLYSDIAHKRRKKSATDNMNAQQIIDYITNQL